MVVQRVAYNNQNDQLYATQDHYVQYIDTQRQWQMAMAAGTATASASTKRNK